MSNDTKGVELLFQRPLEPVFTSRDNGKAAFDLPDSFYTARYKDSNVGTATRFGDDIERKIPLLELTNKPNLDFTQKLGKKDNFSLFNTKHMEIAGKLTELFLAPKDLDSFTALCAYTKDRINPLLFIYCLSVAVQHREDTRNVVLPPIAETVPSLFVEPSVLKDARAEGSLFSNVGNRMHIKIPRNYTASDRESEQRLSYFREDIGVNMHHWHWHLVYPTRGPRAVIDKDRRGELFYYMHHQIIARYNVDRFCNNLAKTKPLSNLREAIPEGYFPKILSSLSNRTYPARVSNQVLRDVDRDGELIEVADCERWRDRIFEAIDKGYVEDTSGNRIGLDEVRGIDVLGNLIEASELSINPGVYGNLHNMGHNLISFAHDPDERHLESFGVMGDVSTAMRDPIFYRWHSFIDNVFNKFKGKLAPYNEQHLGYNGITVDHVQVLLGIRGAKPNSLLTFWQESDVDLSAGLDFGPNGNVYATFIHLQNAPFEYTFNVTNSSNAMKQGTCRIFICPKADERGTPLKLEEQRLLAIEMDKFTVNLNPGQNTIRRRSEDSSVTIPFERSFRRIGKEDQPKAADDLAQFRFCGCGWPQHMLLPKGSPEGMNLDLFVMISDYTNDAVVQKNSTPNACDDAYSFCGLKDKLYPDKRTMGFPFDRRLPGDNLQALVSTFPNMRTTDIKIIFQDKILDKTR